MITEAGAPPGAGRALVLPGARYTAFMHGLAFPIRALTAHGWSVTRAEWVPDAWGDDPAGFVERAVARLDAEAPAASRTLVVGKSLGTRAIPWAAARGVPGIWLPPLLQRPELRTALLDAPRSLLVGGTADPTWQPDDALRARHQVVEIEGMDHGMFVGAGWRESWAALQRVLEAMESFLVTA